MDPTFTLIPIFVFAIGACVGSFLNVVVYRMPLGLSLVTPPSACPKCGHKLAAYDNVPIFGWLWLRGKCRYCGNQISPRYPLVELLTALLFLGHYLLLFKYGWGPYQIVESPTVFGTISTSLRQLTPEHDWPTLLLHLWLIGALLAASLIDLEHYMIPLEICWLTAGIGIFGSALMPRETLGALSTGPAQAAMALGGAIGLALSILLVQRKLLKRSFDEDAPLLEKEIEALPEAERPDPWTPARIRAEMRLEMLFVMIPIVLAGVAGAVALKWPGAGWLRVLTEPHVNGALASIAGGLIGAAVVWFFRIAGSYGFGREAMGLGDVHLMFAVGTIIGAEGSTVAFFLAPAFGLLIAIIQMIRRGKRELPYGPYLSLASYAVLLFGTPIYAYLEPGMQGLAWSVMSLIGPDKLMLGGSVVALLIIGLAVFGGGQ